MSKLFKNFFRPEKDARDQARIAHDRRGEKKKTSDLKFVDTNKQKSVKHRRKKGVSNGYDSRRAEKTSKPPVFWNPEDFKVPAVDGKTRFHDLKLPEPVMHAIADLSFQYCTPIQAEILPSTLEGKDAAGRAQTGTGKTAAFLISVITHLLKNGRRGKKTTGVPRVLVLGPTRELVMQIADEAQELAKYTSLNILTIFGGMDYEKQRRRLKQSSVDIIVATPGRLLDFNRQKEVDLSKVEILIIDEADRMLDMGFIPDVRKIVYKTPHKSKRQTLLFSATLTTEVTRLCGQWTRDPVRVEIEPEQVAVDSVKQVIFIVTQEEKYALLFNIISSKKLERVIVFCNRKDETRRLEDLFNKYRINCAVLSGDIRQRKRVKTLEDFKSGKIRVLVATDVAGRGIHIEGMDHVINYTLPRDPEDYVHRIGRTGRAGSTGTSISFADEDDSFAIPAIEALIGYSLPCNYPDEELLKPLPEPKRRSPRARKKQNGPSNKSYQRSDRSRRSNSSKQHRRRHQSKGGDLRPEKKADNQS
ncbi:MAG: ATP-dependent RNA helicase RhlB [Desulfobacteraceae bacterium]|nr:ATP-dependent RNA helicase RhlB [Desulfobacteraceae bacterium]